MRRRADSPLGPVTHEHPAKRVRRSSGSRSLSPSATLQRQHSQTHQPTRPSSATDTSPRTIGQVVSPSRTSIPPLHPLPQLQGDRERAEQPTNEPEHDRRASFQSFSAAGHGQSSQPPVRGSWAPKWPTGHRSRHSIDTPVVNLKSPSPQANSPGRKERTTEPPQQSSGGSEIVFSRDVTNRQPRSMMACMRCRRQKMKCDGPGKEPCRGCRQAGVPCVFDSRTRPKSISTLPTRASPFFGGPMPQGRGGTPGAGGPAFYPMTAQAAPPITSRPAMVPDYVMRQREPMPPPPNTSISSLASVSAPYPPPLRAHSPPPLHNPSQPGALAQPYYPGHPGPPPPGAPGYPGPPVPQQQMQPAPPLDGRIDGRLRNLESQFRSVSTLPAAVAGIQATLNSLLRTQDALTAQLSGGQPPPSAGAAASAGTITPGPLRAAVDVPEHVWESYRVGAWPLTPWLPGISPLPGLPGLVLLCLGKRAAIERTETTRREGALAADALVAEISRLLGIRVPWTRDEVLSLGVYSTWTSDPALGCLAVGLARDLQLDRPHNLRKSHDEWREWIYVVLADHMLHLPDFNVPIVHEPLSAHWRELVAASTPTDQSTRDRDGKLLAWLEFSELLIEVQQLQRALEIPPTPESRRDSDPSLPDQTTKDRTRSHDIWRRCASKLEAWAGACGARHDPVLSLHFNYAILYTASPAFTANERVWDSLAQSHEGYTQLERGRDAAFAVLQTLGSPEIGRTLGYSFPVLRPFFGLALTHLVCLASTLSHTPIISLPHVQSVLRNVVESLAEAAPLDSARAVSPRSGEPAASPMPQLPPSLLVDMVETGNVGIIGKREVVAAEPGRELWRRLLG